MYTKVPYTTAIEVYLLVNITFILAVMLEYIAVIKIPNCVALKKVSSYFNIFLKSTRYEQSRYDLKRKANVMDKTTLMPEPYHKRISVKQEISLVIHIKTNQKKTKRISVTVEPTNFSFTIHGIKIKLIGYECLSEQEV